MWGSDITVRYITASQVHCQAGPDLSAAQRHIVLAYTSQCVHHGVGVLGLRLRKLETLSRLSFSVISYSENKGKTNQVKASTLL